MTKKLVSISIVLLLIASNISIAAAEIAVNRYMPGTVKHAVQDTLVSELEYDDKEVLALPSSELNKNIFFDELIALIDLPEEKIFIPLSKYSKHYYTYKVDDTTTIYVVHQENLSYISNYFIEIYVEDKKVVGVNCSYEQELDGKYNSQEYIQAIQDIYYESYVRILDLKGKRILTNIENGQGYDMQKLVCTLGNYLYIGNSNIVNTYDKNTVFVYSFKYMKMKKEETK